MVNIYTLRKALSNMSIYSQTQLEQGIWYPLSKYNKPDTHIRVTFETIPSQFKLEDFPQEGYRIDLQSDFKDTDFEKWVILLWKNQWSLYPLLGSLFGFLVRREIIQLPYRVDPDDFQYTSEDFQCYYTFNEDKGTLSLIAKFK